MSVRVLVVPEDPANNGYILKPLVSRMLAECGKPGAVVSVLTNSRAKGYAHAKALLREELLDQPFLAAHGNPKAAGGGRDLLMQEALGSYRSLLSVCEELAELEDRIRRILAS